MRYTIKGHDAFGDPITETIEYTPQPLWKRVLRRIGLLFGIGRWRTVTKITLRDE